MNLIEQIEKIRDTLDISKEDLSIAWGYNRKYWGCLTTRKKKPSDALLQRLLKLTKLL